MKFLKNNLIKTLFVFMFIFSITTPLFFIEAKILCPDEKTYVDNEDDCPSTLDVSNKSTLDVDNGNVKNVVTTKINNPLKGIETIPDLIKALLYIVLVVGVPLVAIAIIYTGFLFIKAQGKPEELTKAKKALTYTLIGAALLLGSWVIANAIGDTVKEIEQGAFNFINLV